MSRSIASCSARMILSPASPRGPAGAPARSFLICSSTRRTRRRRAERRRWSETDFLPAALEVTETPPSPIGRTITWVIIAAALSALLWSFLSHVDTVAVAEGRLVPEGRLRSVEAAQQGVIRAINVHEGQHVTAGQVLIELDPTVADAELNSARSELATAGLTRARDNALLASASGQSSTMSARIGPLQCSLVVSSGWLELWRGSSAETSG